MNNYLQLLKQWIKCKSFEILYDTRKDEYHIKTIQQILYGKKNIITLIQTNENDIFGSYHSSISTKKQMLNEIKHSGWIWENDNEMFISKIL